MAVLAAAAAAVWQGPAADARPRFRPPKPAVPEKTVARQTTVSAVFGTEATTRPALPAAEISKRVKAALDAAKQVPPDPANPIEAERSKFLSSLVRLGIPFAVRAGETTAKYLVPALTRDAAARADRVCGLVHVEPTTGTVLAWPLHRPGPAPMWLRSEAEVLQQLEAERAYKAPALKAEKSYRPVRLGCDPSRLPKVYLIRGWDLIPAKYQDPVGKRIQELNASGRLTRKLAWGEEQTDPPIKSVATAASTVADWWRWQTGLPAAAHTGFLSGLAQGGVDPRELEVQYRSRGMQTIATASLPDPVTGEAVTLGLEGFCKVLSEPLEGQLPEPLETPGTPTPTIYTYTKTQYGMEGQYVEILTREMRENEEPEELLERIDKALRSHGILFARVESSEIGGKAYALHGIAIVGHAELDDEPHVLYSEIHGDRGLEHPCAGLAAPTFKALPVEKVYSAYAFPHQITLAMRRRGNTAQFDLTAYTLHGTIDLDALDVRLGGVVTAGVSLGGRTPHGLSVTRKGKGVYRITVPPRSLEDATSRLIVAGDREHHRGPGGLPATESFKLANVPLATP